MTTDFSTDTEVVRRAWNDMFNHLQTTTNLDFHAQQNY